MRRKKTRKTAKNPEIRVGGIVEFESGALWHVTKVENKLVYFANERGTSQSLAQFIPVVYRRIKGPRNLKSLCIHCKKKFPRKTMHLDRDKRWVCDDCWDERMR